MPLVVEGSGKRFTEVRFQAVARSSWRWSLCPGLDAAKMEQAVALSTNKYCSATVMLGKTADITHDNEVVHTGDAGA